MTTKGDTKGFLQVRGWGQSGSSWYRTIGTRLLFQDSHKYLMATCPGMFRWMSVGERTCLPYLDGFHTRGPEHSARMLFIIFCMQRNLKHLSLGRLQARDISPRGLQVSQLQHPCKLHPSQVLPSQALHECFSNIAGLQSARIPRHFSSSQLPRGRTLAWHFKSVTPPCSGVAF